MYELTGRLDRDKVGEADAPDRLPAAAGPAAGGGPSPGSAAPTWTWPVRTRWSGPPGRSAGTTCCPYGSRWPASGPSSPSWTGELVAYGASVVALAALGGALLASRLSRDLRTAAETARR
ncbi:hypothetical protein [Streptomyces avidinii]